MSTAVIGMAGASPRLKARAAAVFCLCSASSAVATFARRALVVAGDDAATAANIVAHARLFRLALVTDVMGAICFVIVIALLHDFLKGTLSFIAAQAGLAACAMQIIAAPLDVLGAAPFLSTLKIEPLQALALRSLRLHAEALDGVLIFFGIYCVLIFLSFAERTRHAQPLPPATH